MTTRSNVPRHLWAVKHSLDRVEFRLDLPNRGTGAAAELRAEGRSLTKRDALWTYAESFDPSVAHEKGYEAHDAIAHIALVCLQDRPTGLSGLNFALRGGVAWESDTLF